VWNRPGTGTLPYGTPPAGESMLNPGHEDSAKWFTRPRFEKRPGGSGDPAFVRGVCAGRVQRARRDLCQTAAIQNAALSDCTDTSRSMRRTGPRIW